MLCPRWPASPPSTEPRLMERGARKTKQYVETKIYLECIGVVALDMVSGSDVY